jgi:hypothetical protein
MDISTTLINKAAANDHRIRRHRKRSKRIKRRQKFVVSRGPVSVNVNSAGNAKAETNVWAFHWNRSLTNPQKKKKLIEAINLTNHWNSLSEKLLLNESS